MKQLLVGTAAGFALAAATFHLSTAKSVKISQTENEEDIVYQRGWSGVLSETAFGNNPRRGAFLKPATPPKDKLLRLERRELLMTVEQSAIENVCFNSILPGLEDSQAQFDLQIYLTQQGRLELANTLANYDQELISVRLYDWEVAEIKVNAGDLSSYSKHFEPSAYSADLTIRGTADTLQSVLVMARMASGDKIPDTCLNEEQLVTQQAYDTSVLPHFEEIVQELWGDVIDDKSED